jgi:hypothetical protein
VAINGGHHSVAVTVTNTSDEPIYEAHLRWHLDGKPHRDPTAEETGTILPGERLLSPAPTRETRTYETRT